jgi:hypothetical protein
MLMPRRNPAKALQMLDLLEEFFDGGKRWISGKFHDDEGNRCLVGAMRHLRAKNKISGDGTAYYLCDAFADRPYLGVIDFNDNCQSYEDVRAVIEKARARASDNLNRRAPRLKRPHRNSFKIRLKRLEYARVKAAAAAASAGLYVERIAAVDTGKEAPHSAPQPILRKAVSPPTGGGAEVPNSYPGTIPLAVLKYLSPERLAELRATAPGLSATLNRIERERQRQTTIESLKHSIAEAINGREPELVD